MPANGRRDLIRRLNVNEGSGACMASTTTENLLRGWDQNACELLHNNIWEINDYVDRRYTFRLSQTVVNKVTNKYIVFLPLCRTLYLLHMQHKHKCVFRAGASKVLSFQCLFVFQVPVLSIPSMTHCLSYVQTNESVLASLILSFPLPAIQWMTSPSVCAATSSALYNPCYPFTIM